MKSILSKAKGITLIALVITIVIIIVLASVAINLSIGENGIFTKSKQAREQYQKQAAKETINLKITSVQMETYAQEKKLPTLKNIADAFCKDGDFEHVTTKAMRVAINEDKPFILPEIENENPDSIFVELKAYPYEFEIDRELRLASIDGKKVANNPQLGDFVSKSDYESLRASHEQLQTNYNSLLQRVSELENNMQNKADKTELQGIGIQRTLLTSAPAEVAMNTTWTNRNVDIKLNKSKTNFKYLEIQYDIKSANGAYFTEGTKIIATDQQKNFNKDVPTWDSQMNDAGFILDCVIPGGDSCTAYIWFKDDTTLHIGCSHAGRTSEVGIKVKAIYGIN